MRSKVFKVNRIKMFMLLFLACVLSIQGQNKNADQNLSIHDNKKLIYLVVLGTVQDAGSPHAACQKTCCKELFGNPDPERMVVSLGLIDEQEEKKYLFEATPDMTTQMKALKNFGAQDSGETPDGIFLTHAHIGHYTGLMYLGKEAMNSNKVQVFAMPRMKSFLENNGPWNQLVSNQNIALQGMQDQNEISLTTHVRVKPIIVPHRDEYSETVGYVIEGPKKKALFIPDIDKWEKWDTDIVEMINSVDYAFLDATFFDAEEINNRDMSEIPHPFMIESMAKFESLPIEERRKIIFIHMNHTNPVLNRESKATKAVLENGFRIARINDVFEL